MSWKTLRIVFLKKLEKGLRGFPCESTSKCVLLMVYDCSGGVSTRGVGADGVEDATRGSRERSEL